MKKKSKLETSVNKVIRYIKKFEGMKHGYVPDTFKNNGDKPPFWSGEGKPPPLDEIMKANIVCVGLANLARRVLGLQVPGNVDGYPKSDFIGGTDSWFKYLKSRKWLAEIDFSKKYPKGTLLLQDYNKKDQGHVAILINSNKDLLSSKMIHSDYGGPKNDGVFIERVGDYERKERFTHICLPKFWLMKN